jgi:peptidoglycan/LPS O-acetylase OafA/YrhL
VGALLFYLPFVFGATAFFFPRWYVPGLAAAVCVAVWVYFYVRDAGDPRLGVDFPRWVGALSYTVFLLGAASLGLARSSCPSRMDVGGLERERPRPEGLIT